MIAEAPFLFSVAALSVTPAGFAGLVAAFRRGGEWTTTTVFRLREICEFDWATRSSRFFWSRSRRRSAI